MQLEPGSNLGAVAGLPPVLVSQVATAVAGALDHAHAQGFLHGDVRPAAIEIGPAGQPMLGDVAIGALDVRYAAPERIRGGQVDGRADQYSLACTVFRLLTGHDPFPGPDRAAVVAGHLGQPVPSVLPMHPYLGPRVDEVLGQAMAKDPGYRFASCTAFAQAYAASLVPPRPMVPVGPSRRRPWLIGVAAAVVVALAAAVVLVVTDGSDDVSAEGGGGGSVSDLTWDDTLYPQEAESIQHTLRGDELLRTIGGRPTPLWTTPMSGGPPDVVGGDDQIITLRSGTYLIGLAAATGAATWPPVDLQEAPMACAVHRNRIGCVSPVSTGSDSSVFILDSGTGKLLRTIKVPNRDLRTIDVVGDRLVVTTQFGSGADTGFAAGYTTEGDEVWTYEGDQNMYLVPSQGLLVDGSIDGDEVNFVGTDDGERVLGAERVSDERDLTWAVFRGGIAVQNSTWTGTDLYDLDGEKLSSVAGWEPTGYQNVYSPVFALPLLSRLKERSPHFRDENTVAAANPETGHLLWRVDGPELTRQMVTLEDRLLLKVADPDAGTGPDGEPESTGREFVRVHDVYTGETLSPAIDMTGDVAVEIYWIESDGTHLIYNYIDDDGGYADIAYRIETGEKAWEITATNRSGYPGGAIVVAGTDDSVSLYR